MLTPELDGRIGMAAKRRNKSRGLGGIFVFLAGSGVFFLLVRVWCSAEIRAGSLGAVRDYIRKES